MCAIPYNECVRTYKYVKRLHRYSVMERQSTVIFVILLFSGANLRIIYIFSKQS